MVICNYAKKCKSPMKCEHAREHEKNNEKLNEPCEKMKCHWAEDKIKCVKAK
jgi:hypothetical protein